MLQALSRNEPARLAVLAAVCGLLFWVFLGAAPFHDKGEPREALVVRDIVVNGNWLFPLRLGEVIPSKPPLFHWVAAAGSLARGEMTEASVRFPSAFFGTLAVLLIYFLGSRIYDPQTGLLGAVALATTAVFQGAAVEARVDMALAFFVTCSLVLFFSIYRGVLRHGAWTYLFFLVSGAGVLAKGPVSLILCGIVVVAFLAARRRWDFMLALLRHPGVPLGAALFLLWYGSALWHGGSEFFGLQFVKENLARFFIHGEGGTGHQKPVYYFIPYLFTLGMPWTLFLPAVAWVVFASRLHRDERGLFLLIWAFTVLVFFSLSAGKRPPYILPLYPAWCLLMAAAAREQERVHTGAAGVYLKGVGCLLGAVGVLVLAAGFARGLGWSAAELLGLAGIRLEGEAGHAAAAVEAALKSAAWTAAILVYGSGLLWLGASRPLLLGSWRRAMTGIALVSIVNGCLVQALVSPALARSRSYKDFVSAALARSAGRPVLLYAEGVDGSSVFFYGGAGVEAVAGNYQTLLGRLRTEPRCVVMGESVWRSLDDGAARWSVVLRSHGTGPDGNQPLVLVRGAAGGCSD